MKHWRWDLKSSLDSKATSRQENIVKISMLRSRMAIKSLFSSRLGFGHAKLAASLWPIC